MTGQRVYDMLNAHCPIKLLSACKMGHSWLAVDAGLLLSNVLLCYLICQKTSCQTSQLAEMLVPASRAILADR